MFYSIDDDYKGSDYKNKRKDEEQSCYDNLLENAATNFLRKKVGFYDLPKSTQLDQNIITKCEDNINKSLFTLDTVVNSSINSFNESSKHLKERAKIVYKWRAELEEMSNQLTLLTDKLRQKIRQLRNALGTLTICNCIAKECYELRLTRLENDLFDETQQLLDNEITLSKNVNYLHQDLLKKSNDQVAANIAVKELLEFDWSDKSDAYKIENDNLELSNKSSEVGQYPGASRFTEGNSSIESWEKYTYDNIKKCESEIRDTISCCDEIDASLLNSARDLTTQHYKVNKSLGCTIANSERRKIELEQQLKSTLNKVVETEKVTELVDTEMLNIRHRLRVVQSRLNNKNNRPNVESCNEDSHFRLITEEELLNEGLTELEDRKRELEQTKKDLWNRRANVEKEITIKNKSLYIDGDRCLKIRDSFPQTNQLSGHSNVYH